VVTEVYWPVLDCLPQETNASSITVEQQLTHSQPLRNAAYLFESLSVFQLGPRRGDNIKVNPLI
jgi:hypothetical protein